ncbi:SPOR domain-containing protein [Rhizobium sp. PAMB 3174]
MAELARIVGFDPQPVRPVSQPVPEEKAAEDVPAAVEPVEAPYHDVEPVIDLEAELMRELSIDDAFEDSDDEQAHPQLEDEYPLAPEPLAAEPDSVPQAIAPHPAELPHAVYEAEPTSAEWPSEEASAEEVDAYEDEDLAPVAAYESYADEPAAVEPMEDASAEHEAYAEDTADAVSSQADALDDFDESELTRELYLSIGAFADELNADETDEPSDEVEADDGAHMHQQPEMPYDQPAIRLPVSNFRDGVPAEPVIVEEPIEEEAVSQPPSMGFEAEHDRHDGLPEEDPGHWNHGKDDLLDDISRYPIPFGTNAAASDVSISASMTHDFGRALEDEIAMPAIAEEVDEVDDAAIEAPSIEAEQRMSTPAAMATAAAAAAIPKFVSSAFLRARQEPEAPHVSERAQVSEPVRQEPVMTAAASEPDYATEDDVPPMDVTPEETAFDPAMITETEEQPEVIAPLDVPALPEVPEEEPRPAVSAYEVDVDAEMAAMIADYPKQTTTPAPASKATESAQTADMFDTEFEFEDFETALNDDIHRELQSAAMAGIDNDRQYEEERLEHQPSVAAISANRPKRSMLVVASLVLLAGAGAVGAYTWMAGGVSLPELSSEPEIIKADKEAYRTEPANKGGKTVLNQDQAVYDQVSGKTENQPTQGTLISSDEAPVDVVQRTLQPSTIPMEGEADDTADAGASDQRLAPSGESLPADGSQATAENASVAPRKVRTLIVRPDGTLVTREEEPAAALTVTQKNDGAQPSVMAPAEAAGTTMHPDGTQPPVASEASPEALQQVANSNAAADANSPDMAPDTPEEAGPALANAPVPVPRPGDQPVRVVNNQNTAPAARPVETAAAEPVTPAAQAPAAATAPAAAQTTIPAGTYSIQIASLPSEAEAQKSYKNLATKFASVIGGRGMQIVKADIAGKGTYYRVRIAGGTKDEAVALCERYRAAGGSCLVAR